MSLRLLTSGEIALAQSLFENTINYNKVWVHNDSYLPFGLQSPTTAMTPNGEMYYPNEIYRADFSAILRGQDQYGTIAAAHLFMHEMTHVWQFQKGYFVKMHGLLSWAADYTYYLDASSLASYTMEQQASIVADYWLLREHGFQADTSNVKYKGNLRQERYKL